MQSHIQEKSSANDLEEILRGFDIPTKIVNDEAWFLAEEAARRLKYTNTDKALKKHLHPEDMRSFEAETKTIYVNESGLYSLILGSKLPSAKVFKRWVTAEILPNI